MPLPKTDTRHPVATTIRHRGKRVTGRGSAVALSGLWLSLCAAPVGAQDFAQPPRLSAVDYSKLDPEAEAILDNCTFGMWAYCLAEARIPQEKVVVVFSITDADGAPVDCSPQPGIDWTRAHAAACAVIGRFVSLRPDWSATTAAAGYMFDFGAIASAAGHERPAAPARVRTEGYPPLSEEDPCTSMSCRWQYPSRALREEREGTVVVSLIVDETGKGSDCRVLLSSWQEDMDAHACRNLSRWVRFEPATNADGEPLTATYTVKIPYVLAD